MTSGNMYHILNIHNVLVEIINKSFQTKCVFNDMTNVINQNTLHFECL